MPEAITPVEGGAPAAAPIAPPAGEPAGNGAPPADEQKMVPLGALHEARDTIREMRMELDSLKELQSAAFQQPFQGQPQEFTADFSQQRQPQQHQGAQQLEELWRIDPRRAMQQEMTMAFQWYDQTAGAVDQHLDALEKKMPDATKYRSEMQKYLRKMPPQQRADPKVVQAAYYYVKGQNADNLVSMSKEEIIAKIRAGEEIQGLTAAGGGIPPVAPKANAGPTAEQITAAGAMGMPIEEYMKGVR